MKIVKQPLHNLGVSLLGALASTGFALPPVLAEQPTQAVTQAQPVLSEKAAPKVNGSAVNVEPAIRPTTSPFVSATPIPTVTLKASTPSTETSTPAATGIVFITPTNGELLTRTSTAVTVQFPLNSKIELQVNGKPVDPKFIGRTETDTSTQIVKQTWYGVVLQAGSNTLTAYQVGNSAPAASVLVNVPGEPTQLKVSTVEKRLPADGRSTVTVKGQLLDKAGNQSRWNATVTLESTNGEFVGVDGSSAEAGFQVEAINGAFTAILRSSLQSGIGRIRATSSQLEAFTQFEMTTGLRSSGLLSGVVDLRLGARGTNFFDRFEKFLPTDRKNNFELDASAKVFGTTAIGEWLFTGAANSDRALNDNCAGQTTLFRNSGKDCDYTQYPTYGDSSKSEIVAPSSDHVFARLERTSHTLGAGTDYFMWGDYDTQEFSQSSQLFTATSRQLHGFKANYNLGNLQLTALYANNVEGFQRDTIAPDGTRGYYFLSRRFVQPGSEQVFIELEELNRPGTVLKRERLSPGADYEIENDRGSLLFTNPILRTDIDDEGRILTRRIVVTYQFEGEGGGSSLYGGRLRYHFSRELNQESWLGATYLLENRGSQHFELYGADAQWSFSKTGRIIAEYAHSNNGLDVATPVSGNAYRVEVQATPFKNVTGRAFWRTTDVGFANNATTSFVPGQTRYGAEIKAQVVKDTALRFSYDHEDNFGVAPQVLTTFTDLISPGFTPTPGSRVDNSLTTITAGVEQRLGKGNLSLDWVRRDRTDRLANTNTTSDQLRAKYTQQLTKNLDFHAASDITLSSDVDPIYPTRLTAGLDWRVHPDVTVSLNQSYLTGGQFKDSFLTSLDIKGQHKFSTGTTVSGLVSVLGDRSIAGRLGLNQGFTIAKGLKLDLNYEHVFSTAFKNTAAGTQFAQPFAVGSGASALGLTSGDSFSVGLAYTDNPDWKATGRFDYRTSRDGTNLAFTADAMGRFTPSLTGLTSFQWARAANQTLSGLGDSMTLRVGLAYRNPKQDDINALLRYEYRKNPSSIPNSILLGSGSGTEDHLLAAEVLYAPNWRWELYGKVGMRYSSSFLAEDLLGTSMVGIGQIRATYRLGYRWDVAGEFRYIGQPTANYSEIGAVAELGYYLNPNLRLSAGYVFGNISDRDLGGSRSASGPYVGLTIKLDNNLFKDFGFRNDVAPAQKKESKMKSKGVAPDSKPQTVPSA
jgi:hypothetical protein